MFTEGKTLVFICNLNSTFPIVTRLIAVIARHITIFFPAGLGGGCRKIVCTSHENATGPHLVINDCPVYAVTKP